MVTIFDHDRGIFSFDQRVTRTHFSILRSEYNERSFNVYSTNGGESKHDWKSVYLRSILFFTIETFEHLVRRVPETQKSGD